ncbi:thioredoxin-like domain-containing protein [Tundrisphaera sp. TA3]|uniref:thioredoxin-like domain-containing protein n=1 Tax=Tundrisphaera sp. TA3 TaxID=3435775 RepID=UPI003EBBDDB0
MRLHRRDPALAKALVKAGLGVALAALLTAAWGYRSEATPPARQEEVPSLDGAVGWINTDNPIHLDRLKGKIVLLDFWTFCCINCHHVLPDLAKLEAKYKNNLVVVGVHTAKFDAERETENIRAKVHEYQIKHPVANDANQVIWNRFGVRSWPTLALIDARGRYIGSVSGEGHYDRLDQVIGKLVELHRAKGELDETPVEFPSEIEKPHDGGLLYPGKITADAAGQKLYISDTGHNRIVVADLSGKFIEAIGGGEGGLVDGAYAKAQFNRPQGTCLFEGKLYVADTENHAIRVVDLAGKTVATVAGDGTQAHPPYGEGKASGVRLNSPWDVLPMPGTRSLAVAMAGPHQIWKLDLAAGTIANFAGDGRENILDGPALEANLAQPSGLATDGQHLFVADSEVSGVRSIGLGADPVVETIVGVGLFGFGDKDGIGEAVRLQHCLGLAYGGEKLYIADTYNNKIKVCDPKTRAVESLVGDVRRGKTDRPPLFNEPAGLSLAGNVLYVADTNNHAIRTVDLATRKVATLDIASIVAPTRVRVPKFPNPAVVDLPAAEVAPGGSVTLDVALSLPDGFKLSAEAPMLYLVESPGQADVFGPEVSPSGNKIESPQAQFPIKVTLAKPAEAGATLPLRVSVSAFICLPNSLCTTKNYVWNVPVKFTPGAPDKVTLKTP